MLVVEPRKIRIDTRAQLHLISCTYKLIVICIHSSLQIVSTIVKNRVWPAAVHLINAHAAVDPPRTDVEERNNTRHPICTVLFRYSPLAHPLAFISGPRSIPQQGQKKIYFVPSSSFFRAFERPEIPIRIHVFLPKLLLHKTFDLQLIPCRKVTWLGVRF